MALRSSFYRATLVVISNFCSCKGIVAFASPTFKSDSKFDKLLGPEKGALTSSHASTPAPSHVNIPLPTSAESTLALKYSEKDLMRILKIFLKTKS